MIIGGITLPNPEFRDSKNLIGNLIVHTMMSGDKKTHVDMNTNPVYSINISNIKRAVMEALITYLDSNIGGTIPITDWNEVNRNIKITTSPLIFTSECRGSDYQYSYDEQDERYVVELEFEIV